VSSSYTEGCTPVAPEGGKMITYTKEEAENLINKLYDSGYLWNLINPYDSSFLYRLDTPDGRYLVQKPCAGCYALSLWMNILWDKPSNRLFVYEWMGICYCPIREIPIRMIHFKDVLYKRDMAKMIMKWRLETGK
jgi:hypothetical protein